MLKEEYILLDLDCPGRDETLKALADVLLRDGAVKPSFLQAVIEREEKYPTGLPAGPFDVAIPHTTGSHVNAPSVAVGVMRTPVAFMQMGSPEISLNCQIVFMLAINEPNEQLTLLKRIMNLLQDETSLTTLKAAASREEAYQILKGCLD